MKQSHIDDIRQERLEKWCLKHGKKPAVKFLLKDKLALRRWFYSLDTDGSGEVNTDELQHPLLSKGKLLSVNDWRLQTFYCLFF